MAIALDIALAHLVNRKRQTLVSITGVVLGVAFFLGVSGLMRGSEEDFLKRLVDNSPHITVYDEVRQGRPQPGAPQWAGAAVEVRNVRPLRETRRRPSALRPCLPMPPCLPSPGASRA